MLERPMALKHIQIIILAAAFALQYFFEHLYPQRKDINDWKNERFNLAVGVFNLLLSLIPAGFLVQLIDLVDQKQLGFFNQTAIPFYFELLLTILILDAWMYAWHRLNHRVPLLWKFHSFHHKDEKLNSTTALRFHIVELLLSYPGKALVCFIAGIDFTNLLIYEMLFFVSIVVHHSNIYITERMDNLYRILFVSPMMHRIHHSKRKDETDTNFSALFSFWDKCFGSWKGKAKGEVVFGVPEE
jgi:sterol desaturase/sphingolipid hydroxylase (fatty acid hydroxylase superfamily)